LYAVGNALNLLAWNLRGFADNVLNARRGNPLPKLYVEGSIRFARSKGS
jgi:hypothetical protein